MSPLPSTLALPPSPSASTGDGTEPHPLPDSTCETVEAATSEMSALNVSTHMLSVETNTAVPEHTERYSDQSCQTEPNVRSCGVQWEDPLKALREEHLYSALPLSVCAGTQTMPTTLSEEMSEPVCNFYTGLSCDGFWKLVMTVTALVCNNRSMSISDQVLLTLMRLRLGLLYFDLAVRFSISVSQAGKVFREMLGILHNIMSKVVVWLPPETIRATLPQQFADSGYANTICIVDCTEAQMQRPKRLYARGQTYSRYKGGNTVKFLVAIAPSGFIMFISGAYGGRASDKFIVEDSHFADYLSENQEVMADRGFTLTTAMKEKNVKLNVPAFSRGKPQFSEAEATVSRRISRLRIHVERAINRIKLYRILKHSLPIHHKKLMNTIVLVCAGLCNLKGPLIAPKKDEEEVVADMH